MSVIAAGTAGQIIRVVWSSILASVGVAVVFSVAIVGLIRASELRRAGREGVASAYTAVAVAALLVCAGAVVYGVVLVGQKS